MCQHSKLTHHAYYGLLQPIPIGAIPTTKSLWKQVTIDFIVKLSKSKGHDSILVVVNKNTKLAYFIPTNKSIGANAKATLYLHYV